MLISMMDKILFAHIGKSAGTTIGEIFRALVGDSRVFWVEEPEVLTRDQAAAVDAGDYTFVYGQLRSDQEDWFPSYTRKFTIVREPVSRVISTYGYLRQAYAAQRPGAPFMTFDEFIRSDDLLLKNNQSRQLLGVDGFSELSPADAEELVDSKASLLQRFEVIGLFERLQQSFDLISWKFALPRLQSAVAVNVTRDGYKPNPSQDAIAFVERANRIDQALHRRVAQNFERSVAEMMDDLIARSYFQARSAANTARQQFIDIRIRRSGARHRLVRHRQRRHRPLSLGRGWMRRNRVYRCTGLDEAPYPRRDLLRYGGNEPTGA